MPDYPRKALEINALGTRNLLEVLSKKTLKNFIYFSTFHVYGVNSGIITEESPLKPTNDYAITHLFAEYYIKQYAINYSLNYTILRLTNSYGAPKDIHTDKWYLVLNDLVRSAFENKKIVLKSNGKALRDFIYMGDVAAVVHELMILEPQDTTYNLSSNASYEVIYLANIVKSVYKNMFDKNIEIITNIKDGNNYKPLSVVNKKLLSHINFSFSDMIHKEVESIFNLLQNK